MKKTTIAALALALPALGAMAVVPKEEAPVAGKAAPVFSKQLAASLYAPRAAADSENKNSFFEGFEGRDPAAYGNVANRWLPAGWSEFSRKDNAHVGNNEAKWDLTWLTLSNETTGSIPSQFATTAYSGDCFAFIMCDVMWAEKEGPNLEQDEWFVTPAVTPAAEEWFYFKLQFRPGWCLYNRETGDFTGENNLLEVYATEGEGTSESEWTRVWSLKDYILANYTTADLVTDMTSYDHNGYEPIFVNVSQYLGKEIKLAFRFFGVNGQGMALDDVALGIPMPKPSYTLPSGFFKQQSLTPTMDEIDGDYRLLIPFGAEATWTNTSEDILTSEWTYATADGSSATSEAKHLTTPAYALGQNYAAPVLTGRFESRSADYQTPYSTMQAGGRLYGKGKHGYEGPLGVAHYDYLDPTGSLAISSSTIGLHADTDNQWEMLLGRLPETLDVLGMGCLYPATDVPYGFDYVDVTAKVMGDENGKLSEETAFAVTVFRLPDNEYEEIATILGQGVLTGADINASDVIEVGNYKNLRFMLDVPVTAEGDLLVLVTSLNLGADEDGIVIPYMKSKDDKIYGNSVVYMMVYESEENGGIYDTFYNLNAYPFSEGHFAGLLMTLGASYSYMEAVNGADADVVIPYTGGTHTLDVRAMYAPESWAVTANGVTKADWISHAAEAKAGETDVYTTTLTFAENTSVEPRDTDVYVAQAGSRVKLHVVQEGAPSGVASVAAADVTIRVEGGDIVVTGAQGTAEVYNAAGALVASALVDGRTVIPASHLAKGVYIVRAGEVSAKIVK